MAGFQDTLVPFNPYIQEIPVDDYVKVGMAKQQQYNEGLQKVQASIDNVAGLDVAKKEQKDYLTTRIGQLQSQSQKIAGEDFSNLQVVNSVGALTKEIANDPVVRSSVLSTQALRTEQAKMKKAIDAGKSDAANEYVFQTDTAKWLNDGSTTSSFNASYNDYTDYKTKLLKAFNDNLKTSPDQQITEFPFKRDANGNTMVDAKTGLPVFDYDMIKETFKGVSAERIKNVVDSTLNGDDLRQISIDGRYNYRGYDKTAMEQQVKGSYENNLDKVNSTIEGLQTKRLAVSGDPAKVALIDAELDKQKKSATDIQQRYSRDVQGIDQDLEGFKGQQYRQNWEAQFTTGLSFAEHALEHVDNPGFKNAQLEKENNIKLQEFYSNQAIKQAELNIKQGELDNARMKTDIDLYKETGKVTERLSKLGVKPGDMQGMLMNGIPIDIPQDTLPKDILSDFENTTKAQQVQLDNLDMVALTSIKDQPYVELSRDHEGQASGTNPHYVYKTTKLGPDGKTMVPMTQKEIDDNKLKAQSALAALRKGVDDGSASEDVKEYVRSSEAIRLDIKNKGIALAKINADADANGATNINSVYDRIKGLNVNLGNGQTVDYTNKQLVDFIQKFATVKDQNNPLSIGNTTGSSVTNYDEAKAAKLFTTPQEKYLYAQMKSGGGDVVGQQVFKKLSGVYDVVNGFGAKTVLANRKAYIDNSLKGILTAQQGVEQIVKAFKPDQEREANAYGTAIKRRMDDADIGNEAFQPGDQDKLQKMFDDKHLKDNFYSMITLPSFGRDKRYLFTVTNNGVGKGSVKVELDATRAKAIFPELQETDAFEPIQRDIDYSKTGAFWSTDVGGEGRTSARLAENSNLQRYVMKYHVDEPGKGARYQMRWYVHDKIEDKDYDNITQNTGATLSKDQVLTSVSQMNDKTAGIMIDKYKKAKEKKDKEDQDKVAYDRANSN